jgi:hypothetical protein
LASLFCLKAWKKADTNRQRLQAMETKLPRLLGQWFEKDEFDFTVTASHDSAVNPDITQNKTLLIGVAR